MRTARRKLEENVSDSKDILLIEDKAFRESLVGVADGRAVYDADKMVKEYSKYYCCSLSDAREYIEDSIVSMIRKMGAKAPIIMDALI